MLFIQNISTVNSTDLPNIYLLHGEFSNEEINSLYNHSKVKAMISLTKGEGYGRPLLEFSLTGKPIIASGWSGHLDFLNFPPFFKNKSKNYYSVEVTATTNL